MRYNKYDLRGALHWEEYEGHTYYEELVNDSLVPFKDVKIGTVLDAGCGDGLTTDLLSKMGFKLTGVEIEELGIKLAKEKSKEDIEWVCKDLEVFAKECRKFDYLYCLDVIEHLDRPEALIDIMKNVKEFGIIITDDKEVMNKRKDKYHVREFTKDEFKEMFSEFELEEIPITNETYFAYKIMNK